MNLIKRIYARLNKRYRLTFIDNESLSQSRQMIVKPIAGIGFFSAFTLIVIAGTACMIVFTPFIREKIPGYINPELQSKVEMLESELSKTKQVQEETDSLLAILTRVNERGRKPIQPVAYDNPVAISNHGWDVEPEGAHAQPHIGAESNFSFTRDDFQRGEDMPAPGSLIPPVVGFISSKYKPDEKHYGVDIVADKEAEIKSIADGFVIFSEYSAQTGYVIGVSHGNMVSFYKHNSRVFKKVGSYVFAGEVIAIVGNSGENSTGPHLHFELWDRGRPLNPEEYIRLN